MIITISTVILSSDMAEIEVKDSENESQEPDNPTQPALQTDPNSEMTSTPGPTDTDNIAKNYSGVSADAVKPTPKKEGGILSLFITIIVALLLVQVINVFFLQSYRVYGSSMYSTLENDDRLIISKFSKTTSKITGKVYQPKRGEIIVFQSPIDPDIQLIKRVIGLPGDRVVVSDGSITIFNNDNPNGFNPDDAPYGEDLPATSGKTDITVPDNHVFVSGDNREGSNSLDSRNELGTVPEENIIGTLKVRIWPLNNARFF